MPPEEGLYPGDVVIRDRQGVLRRCLAVLHAAGGAPPRRQVAEGVVLLLDAAGGLGLAGRRGRGEGSEDNVEGVGKGEDKGMNTGNIDWILGRRGGRS